MEEAGAIAAKRIFYLYRAAAVFFVMFAEVAGMFQPCRCRVRLRLSAVEGSSMVIDCSSPGNSDTWLPLK